MNLRRALVVLWMSSVFFAGCSRHVEGPSNASAPATSANPVQSQPAATQPESRVSSETPEPKKSASPEQEAAKVRVLTLPGEVKLRMVWCPPGSFMMGSPTSEPDRDKNDEDQVSVTLTHGFWLGETEVTQSQWQAVMKTAPWEEYKPYKPGGDPPYQVGPDYPASHMFHSQAAAFCAAVDQLQREAGQIEEGWAYTLPTEAQWEYACRAGTTTAYSFGDSPNEVHRYAWIEQCYEWRKSPPAACYPHLVKTKLPNPWGLYDMHGNCWEWCFERFDFFIYPKHQGGIDPHGSSGGNTHFCRGGGLGVQPKDCRSAVRKADSDDWRQPDHGLRLALTHGVLAIPQQ